MSRKTTCTTSSQSEHTKRHPGSPPISGQAALSCSPPCDILDVLKLLAASVLLVWSVLVA
jgi:hypothetical protein